MVADGQRRRQHRAPDAGRARRPGLEGRLPRLATGFIARQRSGAWRTTTANLWGALALDKFSPRSSRRSRSPAAAARRSAPRRSRRRLGGAARAAACSRCRGRPAAAARSTYASRAPASPGSRCRRWPRCRCKAPLAAGYRVTRSVGPVEQKTPGRWSRGDVLRVTLRGRRAGRHDLGGRQRPGAGRRDHPRQRPRPRFADRDARREADGRAAGRPSRNAASRPSAATTSTCRAASTSMRVHACA